MVVSSGSMFRVKATLAFRSAALTLLATILALTAPVVVKATGFVCPFDNSDPPLVMLSENDVPGKFVFNITEVTRSQNPAVSCVHRSFHCTPSKERHAPLSSFQRWIKRLDSKSKHDGVLTFPLPIVPQFCRATVYLTSMQTILNTACMGHSSTLNALLAWSRSFGLRQSGK